MEAQRPPGIMRIATKYGLIQGVFSFALNVVTSLAGIKPTWIATALNVAVLIVLMILAHREFKRTHGGIMMYPEGLGSGTLLSIVGAVVTAVLMYVYLKYINPGSLATLLQAQQAALEERGITGAQARQAMSMVSAIMTPVGISVITLIVEVILGFIVALILSIFTHKSTHQS
jgi:Protein of unknown function (DUF4199)